MPDDLQHPYGYRVPDSILERLLGCPVYWSAGTGQEQPKPPGSNILDILDPTKRPPRQRGQRQRPRAAARRMRP
jgi:hypothetical protein